jgi:hypothetical protein
MDAKEKQEQLRELERLYSQKSLEVQQWYKKEYEQITGTQPLPRAKASRLQIEELRAWYWNTLRETLLPDAIGTLFCNSSDGFEGAISLFFRTPMKTPQRSFCVTLLSSREILEAGLPGKQKLGRKRSLEELHHNQRYRVRRTITGTVVTPPDCEEPLGT